MDYMDNYQLSDNIIITYIDISFMRGEFLLQVPKQPGHPNVIPDRLAAHCLLT